MHNFKFKRHTITSWHLNDNFHSTTKKNKLKTQKRKYAIIKLTKYKAKSIQEAKSIQLIDAKSMMYCQTYIRFIIMHFSVENKVLGLAR